MVTAEHEPIMGCEAEPPAGCHGRVAGQGWDHSIALEWVTGKSLLSRLVDPLLTLSLPKATIGANGTVPEATIVAHIPWLPLATIGAVFIYVGGT